MLTCTWAPTTFQGTQVVAGRPVGVIPSGSQLADTTLGYVQRVENLGISHLLIAQRWWGTGEEIEASSLDCLAMTAFFAAHTSRLNLITAIHPGFFHPTAIAKWGATMDRLTEGRWAINLTSGWNLQEFDMYGVDPLDHDLRYLRAAEFVALLRKAWNEPEVSFRGAYYHADGLRLEPRPEHPLTVYQGGQSDAALQLAAQHSDWMFLNGGAPEKIGGIVERARGAYAAAGRTPGFALYAAPLCRATDAEAWAAIDEMLQQVNPELVAKRRERVSGAQGMWADDEDPLSSLDTNEGYASRLIGSPATILEKIAEFQALGVDMLHLDLRDSAFVKEVLPQIQIL
ncbi:MAG: LLM class flavin-dependent oxidoreductase [Gammaproteobacteria bacterium]|nr:LLM class flavin-dependent oxidoreductase [Gammaproteobacteria bacterium]